MSTPADGGTVLVAGSAHQIDVPGVTVLLAPAAASMDQFTDHAQRGEGFRAAVEAVS